METDSAAAQQLAPVLLVSEARAAAELLCRAEDWLQDVDPELAREAGFLRTKALERALQLLHAPLR